MFLRTACTTALVGSALGAIELACGERLELVDSRGDAEAPDAATSGSDAGGDVQDDAGRTPRPCSGSQFTLANTLTLGLVPKGSPGATLAARSVDFQTWFYGDVASSTLVAATLAGNAWQNAPWVDSLNGKAGAENPAVTTDTLRIVYERVDGASKGLWFSRRSSASSSFDSPRRLDIDRDGTHHEPYLVDDTAEVFLYFVGADNAARSILESKLVLTDGSPQVSSPKVLSTLGSGQFGFPVVTRDRLEIFYSAPAPKPSSVFHARRSSVNEEFGTPIPLDLQGLVVNSQFVGTRAVELSADGCTLVVSTSGSPEKLQLFQRPK